MRRCGGCLRGRGRRARPGRWLWLLRLGATLVGRCGGTVSGRGGLDGRRYGEGVVEVLGRGLTILVERCGERRDVNLARTAVRPWVNGLPRRSKNFVFLIADVSYKIWSGRSTCLEGGREG